MAILKASIDILMLKGIVAKLKIYLNNVGKRITKKFRIMDMITNAISV
jgi:hypothetical protein